MLIYAAQKFKHEYKLDMHCMEFEMIAKTMNFIDDMID